MRTAAAGLALALSLLIPADLAWSQTADEVIERSITALGGRAAHAKLKSRSIAGTIVFATPAGDFSGAIEILNAAPNKIADAGQSRLVVGGRRAARPGPAIRRLVRLRAGQHARQSRHHRQSTRQPEERRVSSPVPELQGHGYDREVDRQGEGWRARGVCAHLRPGQRVRGPSIHRRGNLSAGQGRWCAWTFRSLVESWSKPTSSPTIATSMASSCRSGCAPCHRRRTSRSPSRRSNTTSRSTRHCSRSRQRSSYCFSSS